MFVGSAGLPLFNDVDEQAHFDLIHKLARGYWPVLPREQWDQETAEIDVAYGTFEFLSKPETYPGGVYPPPVWTWAPSRERDDYVQRKTVALTRKANHEVHSPPVYYLAGTAWYKLGRFAGLQSPENVYWIRFLNVPLYAALIATAYAFCRAYFSQFVALAVPALIALFPSTIFFGINSDALSPLLMLLALWLLLRWQASLSPSAWLSLLAGLLTAAAFLVKLSNVAILATCVIVVVWRWYQAHRAGTFRGEWPRGAMLLLALCLPIACWMLQNKYFLGDLMGIDAKVRELGWRHKPVSALFHHPLYSFAGQRAFWSRLVTSFYVGDMNWHGSPPMKFVPSEIFYRASFILLPIALGLVWFRNRQSAAGRFHVADGLCAFILAGSVGFLMVQSLMWDFGACPYPSRAYPYLNSGRLIAGAVVPFLALYAWSVEAVFNFRKWACAAVLALSAMLMVLPQTTFLSNVLHSRYNWFHLRVPGSESEAYTGLGLISLDRGRLDEAAERFAQASALNPANLVALGNLAMTLAEQGKYESATQAFTQALQIQPTSAELHDGRGTMSAMQDNWADAADDYREAVRLSPQTSAYRFPLAYTLSRMGRLAEAEREYAAALRSAPNWPEETARTALQMSTHPDRAVRLRLAARAVQLAEQANGARAGSRIDLLEVLAAAYSESGRLEEAIATVDKAIRIAEETGATDLAARLRERQDDYRKRMGSN